MFSLSYILFCLYFIAAMIIEGFKAEVGANIYIREIVTTDKKRFENTNVRASYEGHTNVDIKGYNFQVSLFSFIKIYSIWKEKFLK